VNEDLEKEFFMEILDGMRKLVPSGMSERYWKLNKSLDRLNQLPRQ